jgi:predicted CxxxxCH...CXXCH cytochrome family protein
VKNSYRQPWLAPLAVIVAALVFVACGQVTTSEDTPGQAGALRQAQRTASVATQGEADACYDPQAATCTPTGAHAKHTSDCTVCHVVAGRLAFRVGPPAYPANWAAPQPRPSFDAINKTCSNVACHAVPAGTYTYTVYDWGADELIPVTVPYGGPGQGPSPSWYTSGGGCTACHNLKYGTTTYSWHSGQHGYVGQSVKYNQCQTCHPDASGFIQTDGTFPGAAITNAAQHANGVLNVVPQWNAPATNCQGCH